MMVVFDCIADHNVQDVPPGYNNTRSCVAFRNQSVAYPSVKRIRRALYLTESRPHDANPSQ